MKKLSLLAGAGLLALCLAACSSAGSDKKDGGAQSGNDTTQGDGTVADELEWCNAAAGLCWTDPPSPTPMNWADAADYCKGLVWAGHDHWKLADLASLRWLVKGCSDTEHTGACGAEGSCKSSECLTSECAGCEAGKGPDAEDGGCYWDAELHGPCGTMWSSTNGDGDAGGSAWAIDFTAAEVQLLVNTETHPFRCVRPLPQDEDINGDVPDTSWGDAGDTSGDTTAGPDLTVYDYGAGDTAGLDTVQTGCKEKYRSCDGDKLMKCESGEWVLDMDCYEYWMTCGPDNYGSFACNGYPDCTSDEVGKLKCWGSRALKCTTGGIDWQLQEDCSRYQDMFCQSATEDSAFGHCLHNAGPTWKDAATGLEWERHVFPEFGADHFTAWAEANTYCQNLVWGDPAKEDWRLPTISELRTLVRGCADTQTGGGCGFTDSCLAGTCYTGECAGCTQFKGPALDVGDNPKGAYIVDQYAYEFHHLTWSMYFWSSSNCQYYTDKPENQRCRLDYRAGKVEGVYTTGNLGYPLCVRP